MFVISGVHCGAIVGVAKRDDLRGLTECRAKVSDDRTRRGLLTFASMLSPTPWSGLAFWMGNESLAVESKGIISLGKDVEIAWRLARQGSRECAATKL